MITPNLFPAAMRKGLDAASIIGLRRPKVKYPGLFKIRRTKNTVIEVTEFGDLNMLAEKNVGGSVAFVQPEQAWTQKAYPKTMALGLQIAEETIEDDGIGICAKYVKRMAACAPKTLEYDAALLFNTGDVTTNYSLASGLAVFATTHQLTPTSPATYSTLNTPATLSASALQAALTSIRTRKDQYGLPIAETPVKLIVAPALEWKAAELLESVLSPEDNRNAVNVVRSLRNLKLQVWEHLTNANHWIIQCEEHGLYLVMRKSFRTGQGSDFASGNREYKGVMRYVYFPEHPRGILSSTA